VDVDPRVLARARTASRTSPTMTIYSGAWRRIVLPPPTMGGCSVRSPTGCRGAGAMRSTGVSRCCRRRATASRRSPAQTEGRGPTAGRRHRPELLPTTPNSDLPARGSPGRPRPRCDSESAGTGPPQRYKPPGSLPVSACASSTSPRRPPHPTHSKTSDVPPGETLLHRPSLVPRNALARESADAASRTDGPDGPHGCHNKAIRYVISISIGAGPV